MTRIISVLALSVAFTVQAAPHRSTYTCLTLLTADPCKVTVTGQRSTVRLVRDLPGRHGGRLWLAERVGRSWGSKHTTVHYDVQGDPRWFMDAIGCRAAGFFGFEAVSEKEILLPDRAEFMGALAKVNQSLIGLGHEPIAVSFYDGPEKFSSSTYLRHFLDDLALPIAPSGNHFLHDMSFHTGAIFFSEKMLRAGAESIRRQIGNSPDSKKQRLKMVELIDVATSVPNLRLIVEPNQAEALAIMQQTLADFDMGQGPDLDHQIFRRLMEIRSAVRSLEP